MEKIEHTMVSTNGITIHVASLGSGPEILFLHGYPELWYSWRHQIVALSALGYCCIAPDLRGYGDSDAPAPVSEYNVLRIVGDLIGLLDELQIRRVFLVGHDWGSIIAWYFGLFRPDRIKAMVNMSDPFYPRNPGMSFVQKYRSFYGNDYYDCPLSVRAVFDAFGLVKTNRDYVIDFAQKIGEPEAEYAQIDTAKLFRIILTSRNPYPPANFPKDIGKQPDPKTLPSWLSNEDVNYYAYKFNQTGFTGGINYYRSWDLTWELTAAWTGAQVKVPTKYIIGDLDLVYNTYGIKDYIQNGDFQRDVPLLKQVVIMKDVGHFLNQEKPDEISKHIYDFFQKFGEEQH